jgi:hemolysin activation/secretion protein
VLNTQEVQQDIVALNQSPDLVVTPRLRAGAVPGTVDVDLVVEDEPPVSSSLEVNNQQSQSTAPVRLVGSVAYNNLWQLGHAISLTYQGAPQDPSDSEVLSGTYMFRVPRTPVSILAYAVQSDSDVAALANTNVVGRGTIFGARAIVNLPGSEGFFHSITAGIDRKNLTQNVITGGIPSNATVLYYPITVAYAATWQEDERVTRANASLNFALPVGSDSAKFDLQRFDALRQYIYVRGDVSHAQPLPRGFSLYGKLAGQFSGDALLSSEQLSAGGVNTVRGYLESERLGDYGAIATLELRSPNFGPRIAAPINEWRIHIFADGAAMSRRNPLPGEQVALGIAGAGIGTRFTAFQGFNGAFDLAYALTDGLATDEGDTRLHFRLWSGF